MKWKELEKEIPNPGQSLWLFGTDDLNGHERFDVGRFDEIYHMILSDHGPTMHITHWAYCEPPTKTESAKGKDRP